MSKTVKKMWLKIYGISDDEIDDYLNDVNLVLGAAVKIVGKGDGTIYFKKNSHQAFTDEEITVVRNLRPLNICEPMDVDI